MATSPRVPSRETEPAILAAIECQNALPGSMLAVLFRSDNAEIRIGRQPIEAQSQAAPSNDAEHSQRYNATIMVPSYYRTISKDHCVIKAEFSQENQDYQAVLYNNSRNVTMVDGQSIIRGDRMVLGDKHSISIGSPHPPGQFVYAFERFAKASIKSCYWFGPCIGTGAFGSIYKATSVATGTVRAIKVIKDKVALQDWEFAHHSVRREVDTLKKLSHPHIVKLLAWERNSVQLYLVMELGLGSLDDYFQRPRWMPIQITPAMNECDVRSIVWQVTSALEYLHGKRIMHRDIKPSNIIVFRESPFLVKMSDFGESREYTGDTIRQTQRGTLAYMPPEVVLAGRPEANHYDLRVDLWGLGVTAFYLLSGLSPFIQGTAKQNVKDTRIPDFQLLPSYTSSHARQVIQGLVTRDPQERMSLKSLLSHPWISCIEVDAQGAVKEIGFIPKN